MTKNSFGKYLILAITASLGFASHAHADDRPISFVAKGATITLNRDLEISGGSDATYPPLRGSRLNCHFEMKSKSDSNRILKAGRTITISSPATFVGYNGNYYFETTGDKNIRYVVCEITTGSFGTIVVDHLIEALGSAATLTLPEEQEAQLIRPLTADM